MGVTIDPRLSPIAKVAMLGCHSDCLHVLSLPALWPLGHVELHRLPFLQAAEAACLDSGEMHEDIPLQIGG